MSQLVVPSTIGQSLSKILKPYEQHIYLESVWIAGTSHVSLPDTLQKEEVLVFYREPKNEHDTYAVRIENQAGEKVGYIPKKQNKPYARLMDAGKYLYGVVTHLEQEGNWLRILMRIYLRD